MDLDEVVAANVRLIREEKGLSVAGLADRLGVGRHVVYDFERPRKDAAQRAFLWSEIVNLCGVLGVTIFELVLPPEGERSFTFSEGFTPQARKISSVVLEGSDELQEYWWSDDRGVLMQILFGADFKPEHVDTFIEKKEARLERLRAELRELLGDSE